MSRLPTKPYQRPARAETAQRIEPESLVLPGFDAPVEAPPETTPAARAQTAVRTYYVRVALLGADGTQRRGTVAIDGAQLRRLTNHLGSAREARQWIRERVEEMCRTYPQDLSLGAARWKTATGLSLKDYVQRGIEEMVARSRKPAGKGASR